MEHQGKPLGRPRARELTSATNSLVKVFRRALADLKHDRIRGAGVLHIT